MRGVCAFRCCSCLSTDHPTLDLLTFAYFAQCRCDPPHTIQYFTHLVKIFETFQKRGLSATITNSEELQTLIAAERSRGRFTESDIKLATHYLGFGKENELGVELDDEVDDDFILNAWKNGLKRSWREDGGGAERRTDLNDSFKIISDVRGGEKLRNAYKWEKNTMSPDAAYATLEVPKEVDETMLITVYSMRVCSLQLNFTEFDTECVVCIHRLRINRVKATKCAKPLLSLPSSLIANGFVRS